MASAMNECDVLVVGGGIAGASLGARLAPRLRVLLIEAEDQPGYHTSGRSAAFWQASYGGPEIAPLSLASHAELEAGWPGTGQGGGWLRRRGAIHLADRTTDDRDVLAALQSADRDWRPVDRAELDARLPGLSSRFTHAFEEPSCADIDTAGLLGACLAAIRRAGGGVEASTALISARRLGDSWHVETSCGAIRCGTIVNAAGAWGDEVARRCGVEPIGATPLRRTVVQLRLGRSGLRELPLVIFSSWKDGFYVKGEGDRRVWISPLDVTPDEPGDVAAHEEDVAVAIDRFQGAFDWPIEAVERKWAGLRTFAGTVVHPPMVGPDPDWPGFAWSIGLGGWGFQTAPALSAIGAAALLDEPLPDKPRRPERFLFRRS